MDSRGFVSAGLFLFALVTVCAQSNSPNQGRGSLIRVIHVNNRTLKNDVQLLIPYLLACIAKITLVKFLCVAKLRTMIRSALISVSN